MSSHSIHHIIQSTAEREKKLFEKGYHYIYRNVETQIRTLIRTNPYIQQASVTIPQYAKLPIVIPMVEGKKYVKQQLGKRNIQVLSDDGSERLFISWASLSSHSTDFQSSKSSRSRVAPITVDSSSSSDSSPSPSPPSRKTIDNKATSSSSTVLRATHSTSANRIPPDVARRLEELHILVLRAASGC